MLAVALASAVLSWLTPADVERRVMRGADPGQYTAITCEGRGPHHGNRWRRFECAASGGACLYYLRVRVVRHSLRYTYYDSWCP